jgi:tetratricopeptide (TPR) repeat protein
LVLPGQSQAHQWLQTEFPNLLAGTRHAVQANMDAIAWQLSAISLTIQIAAFDDHVSLYQMGLIAARRLGNRNGEYVLLDLLGGLHYDRGRFAESVEFHQLALSISREIGARYYEALALHGIGSGLRELGRPSESVTLHKLTLDISRELEDEWWTGISHASLGHDHRKLGHFREAIMHYARAEEILQAINDQLRLSYLWEGRAAIAMELGQYTEAFDLYGQALKFYREVGFRYYEIRVLVCIGELRRKSGKPGHARQCLDEALTICQDTHDPRADEIRARLAQLDADNAG